MVDPHGRYEQLAVGHVLGGLGTSDAADFRSHLLGCSACRTRVAELRDIATDLEAAERDERQRARVRTELPRRTDDPDREDARGTTEPRITIRHVTAAVIVVLSLAGAMAFWNLHLRSGVALVSTVVDQQAQTLRGLASGEVIPAEHDPDTPGLVVLGEGQVAFSLSEVADVAPGDSIVAWLLDEDGEATEETELLARPGRLDDGLVSLVLPIGDAVELVVSRETGIPATSPAGHVLLRADLRPVG